VKLALAQLNPTIGDVRGNAAAVESALRRAADAGAALAVFAEQTLLGYPAKDLLLRPELIDANLAALDHLAALTARTTAAIVGFAERNPDPAGRPLFNSAALLAGGEIRSIIRKQLLPNYDVFDEMRYFEEAPPQPLVSFADARIGLTICEDLLFERMLGRSLYDFDPTDALAAAGVDLIVNISASPFCVGKTAWRMRHMAAHARKCAAPLVCVNQVGGNDELLFDGGSFALDAQGRPFARAATFAEDLLVVEALAGGPPIAAELAAPQVVSEMHDALVMGIRDYVRKCGFRHAVVGLSGGIDSALVASLAATALGAANVHGVAMPSRFSSEHSLRDAEALAANLGIRYSVVPIEPMHAAFEQSLAPLFAGAAPDVAEENIQARCRGIVLMALSNKFGGILLTTGNKSELAVGYCTLYGDMCGGLAVISDVPKTRVYDLARHVNALHGRAVIPESTISKPPSAELRPDQFDQQSLPPYEVVDAVLDQYEAQLRSEAQIAAAGHDPATVADLIRKIRTSEYKRQQAAPGLKVTTKAFGFGRRMPIAARPTQ